MKEVNTEEQSDMDKQVSEEEDNVEFHPEETDISDESDEEVTIEEFAESPKMVRSFGGQYLIMHMAGQLLQMSSK